MPPSLPMILALAAGPPATHPTQVWQVAPDHAGRTWWQASEGRKDRAVLLIHGLKIHPIRWSLTTQPEKHDWQEPKADLVKALAAEFDVFAFGYAQTLPVDAVAHSPGLREAVARMRAGYKEVVLIGHSAGGLVARQFAEAYPDGGATKVIQVASPNAGSDLAKLKVGYPKTQAGFVQSLAPAARLDAAAGNRFLLSPRVECVSVVCKVRGLGGDGLVALDSQWPPDLQVQGVPAALLAASHWEAMRSAAGVKSLVELSKGKLTRWTPEQVDQARKVLFREPDDPPKKDAKSP